MSAGAGSTPLHLTPRSAAFRQSVGLSSLSKQIYRKVARQGYEFTLMVCGEANLGKSTLLQTLFSPEGQPLGEKVALKAAPQTLTVQPRTIEINEHGISFKLNIIDTPGFGDAVNNSRCWEPLVQHIDDAFKHYLRDESSVDRKNIKDERVHCLLYFLNPSSHGMRPLDIETMKQLHRKVNIVPIIAKADTLNPDELKNLKNQILAELAENNIGVFTPAVDADEGDDEACKAGLELAASMPFAVVGANTIFEVGGRVQRGRQYPWGLVEVDNPAHSDFGKLRDMLMRTHLHDLKDITAEVHYELYRKEMLVNRPAQPLGGAVTPTRGGADPAANAHGADSATESLIDATPEGEKRRHEQMKRDVEEQARLLEKMREKIAEDERRYADI